MTQRHIITLPDHDLSNSAARRNKFWMKVLIAVDLTESNGYAFKGAFRDYGATVELDEGAWVLAYMENRRGSGRLDWHHVTLYQVQDGKLTEVEHWKIDGDDRGWALHVRDTVHRHMTTPPAQAKTDTTALLAEREQLLARLAEIDALLPEPEGTDVDTRHAAEALGVTVRTVQRWAATGKVTARKDAQGRWVVTITTAASPTN